MPFWSTFFRALGFEVKLSRPSTRKMYESGLSAVTSDTVCFPAKLVHGHIRDLVKQGVDRIFMPSVTTVPSENTQKTSESMCAVVKGYPLIIRNSDDPERQWGVPFDAPLFHWYTDEDRLDQLTRVHGGRLPDPRPGDPRRRQGGGPGPVDLPRTSWSRRGSRS